MQCDETADAKPTENSQIGRRKALPTNDDCLQHPWLGGASVFHPQRIRDPHTDAVALDRVPVGSLLQLADLLLPGIAADNSDSVVGPRLFDGRARRRVDDVDESGWHLERLPVSQDSVDAGLIETDALMYPTGRTLGR